MVENTIGQILKDGVKILTENNIDNPLLEAQLLISNILNVDKLYVMTNYDKELSIDNKDRFFLEITRRCMGMPLQYIVGKQEFMSLQFEVNSSVLIPRPDTEILIDEILDNIDQTKTYNILEIGTGSGCIAISLAKYIENSIVHTVDISKGALEVAKKNALLNNVDSKIKFYHGNIFSSVTHLDNYFDFIVSNPPYIPKSVIESLGTNVRDYEPRLALDGGNDGLDFYREICADANKYLKENGMIFFEIGHDQATDVKKLLNNNSFDDIYVVKDLAMNDRVVVAKKKIKQ